MNDRTNTFLSIPFRNSLTNNALFILILSLMYPIIESFYVVNLGVGNDSSKINNASSIGDFYLVNPRNGECRMIPDVISRNYLVFKAHLNVYNLSVAEMFHHSHSSINQLRVHNSVEKAHCHHIGTHLPSFILSERTPDDIVLKHMVLFEAIQGSPDFLILVKHLDACFNPSIAPFVSGDFPHVKWIVGCRAHSNGGLQLLLLNESFDIIDDNQSIYGIGPGPTEIPTAVNGEDFRVLEFQDNDYSLSNQLQETRKKYPRFLLSYVFYRNGAAQIRAAELHVTDNKFTVINDCYLYDPRFEKQHQKNWVPFFDHHRLIFLQNIWPQVTAVGFRAPITNESVVQDDESHLVGSIQWLQQAKETDVIWDFGMIKGGTPARQINNDTFLAFFHSKQYLTPNPKVSYVFGAYTFSAQPPYNITAFSRTPIVHRTFYDGPWSHWGFIDYIVFPMSFAFEDRNFDYRSCGHNCFNQTNLVLSIGLQDKDGWIVRLNLKQLLDTLVKIHPLPGLR